MASTKTKYSNVNTSEAIVTTAAPPGALGKDRDQDRRAVLHEHHA